MDSDFIVFWKAGTNFLHGLDPYAIKGNYYPPAANLLFAVMAFLPLNLSFQVWRAIYSITFLHALSRKMSVKKALIWFLFFPTLFLLYTGQPDILFFWFFALGMDRKGWPAAFAAALLTLKPQIALVALPWILVQWLLHDRKTLMQFVGFSGVIALVPLAFNPQIYQQWILVTSRVTNAYVVNSPGFFSLTTLSIPAAVFIPIGLALAAYGLFFNRELSLSANFLATPLGTWYNTIFLAGTAPWQLLIPVSWIAFILAAVFQAAYPFILISLAAFIWILRTRRSPDSALLPGAEIP